MAVWLAWSFDLKEQGIEVTGRQPTQSRLALPWHRIALPVTVAALVLTGSLAFLSLNSSAATLDPGTVAVLPFRADGAAASRTLRSDVAALLAAQLHGNGRPRAADVNAVAAAYAGIVRKSGVPSLPEAEGVARAVGAGQVVIGSIVMSGDELVLRASILTIANSQLATATVHTTPDSLEAATATLANRLLHAQKKAR